MRPATNPRGCESEYRPNVGLMVMNRDRRCLWGRRSDNHFWQFPQGGIESANRRRRRWRASCARRPG